MNTNELARISPSSMMRLKCESDTCEKSLKVAKLKSSFVSGDLEGKHSGCETPVDPSDASTDPGKDFVSSSLIQVYVKSC